MPTDAKKPTSDQERPSKSAAIFVFSTMLDTTWRIFVPVLLGLFAGWWADKQFDTLPLWIIIGTVLGGLTSGGLIYQQIKRGMK